MNCWLCLLWSVPFLPSPEVLNSCYYLGVFLFCLFLNLWSGGKLTSMRACKPLPYGQLTTALVPNVPSPCFLRQSSTVAKVREIFCVSFVLIRFVIGELLSEVGGRVGHGLVLAWFESYVLRLVFLDSSLQSPGQEKHFAILFTSFRDVVREIQLSVYTWWKR